MSNQTNPELRLNSYSC